MDEDGYGTVAFLLRGSGRFDSVRGRLFAVLLLGTTDIGKRLPTVLCVIDYRQTILAHRRGANLKALRELVAKTMNFDGLSPLWLRNVTTYVFATAGAKIAKN